MNNHTILAVLFTAAAFLPSISNAQSDVEVRYPDGTVIQPLPVVPSISPGSDVDVTGSIAPRTITAPTPAPVPQRSDPAAADRHGCDLQSYVVGSGQQVRIHRC
jgi:hypothetical protein